MKKISLTVEDHNLSTVIAALQKFNIVKLIIESEGAVTEDVRRVKHFVSREGTSQQLIMEYIDEVTEEYGDFVPYPQIREMLTRKGFSPNTAAPSLSTLVKQGKLIRGENDTYAVPVAGDEEDNEAVVLIDLVLGELKKQGTMRKQDIKQFIIDQGKQPTGAGPMMTQLEKQGCVRKVNGRPGWWGYIKDRQK